MPLGFGKPNFSGVSKEKLSVQKMSSANILDSNLMLQD
jgi:hypothetical protein